VSRKHLWKAVAALAISHGCGGSAAAPTPPEPVSAVTDMFPVDVAASRYHPMHRSAFGPIWGSGCPVYGDCGCERSDGLAKEFNCQLDHLSENDIPISVYLFDGHAWSKGGSDAESSCSGPDCCVWDLGDQVIDRLAQGGVRGLLHYWGGCHNAEQYSRASTRLGGNLLGFYLDDGSSDEELAGASQYMESAEPGDWEVFAKAFQNREPSTTPQGLSRWANAAYVGDLPVGFDGLHQAVVRLLEIAPRVPAPMAELTGYAFEADVRPDEEVYYRRLHFGALQPVMAHTPYANADPWRGDYGPGLVKAYRYWAWLHRQLVPYFYSLAYRMYEDPGKPVLQAGPMPDSLLIGDSIYAPIVTTSTASMDIELPPGNWVDYWDETHVVSGQLSGHPVPLGREPIFIRQGAIIPMRVERPYTGFGTTQSAGSLTVAVYPDEGASSSFRYRPDANTPWITFSSTVSNQRLSLTADPALPAQPVIYRVAQWGGAPDSVAVIGNTVTVNQGGDMTHADSETATLGTSDDSWYYDAAAQRLIIKVVP
jgi:Glycosyl hydrolase family 31 C-terminal domain/Glycosyl hydrolases family 31 TIM-barrel domain